VATRSRPEMMIASIHFLFSRRIFPPGIHRWSQHSPYTNVSYPRANWGLCLVSVLGLTAFLGSCSWSQLNLDSATQDSSSTRKSPRGHQTRRTYYNESYTRNDGIGVHVHRPHACMQTFEQSVFPGNHTGVARYDTAKSTLPGCVSLPL
jgi:hypothetical protein